MNTRGQYGNNAQGRVQVGAFLVHTLEMRQRYNNVKTVAVQALLNDLSREGVATSTVTNRWEIALKEGPWVLLAWHPDSNALEVTITDRELRPVDQLASIKSRYEALLNRITPRLKTFGATTVGAAIVGQAPVQSPAPRFAARTHAVRAVFDMYTHARMPYYLYAELNGIVDKRGASSLDEANALFAALERSPGEVYVAIFDPTDPLWPGPSFDVYNAAPQLPHDRPTIGQYDVARGVVTLLRTVPDRENVLRALKAAVNSTYQELAQQILHATPEHPYGLASDATIRPDWFAWWKQRADPFFQAFRNWATDRGERRSDALLARSLTQTMVPQMYAQWHQHLAALRREAEEMGIRFRFPLAEELNAIVGLTLYHSVGDRADAVKQMDVDWGALYQNLATEVGEIPYDQSQIDWSKRPPAVQQAREEELAAWKAIDAAPAPQKPAAVKRAQELTQRRGQLYLASFDPKKVAWWKSYASPIFAQWNRFKLDQLGGDRTVADDYISFAERFQTNWDVYEN